jgi:hypothetical protein
MNIKEMNLKNVLIAAGVVLGAGVVAEHTVVRPVLAQVRAELFQNVDEPGRNTFTLSGTSNDHIIFSVPAGKRYVVQKYSANCTVRNNASLLNVGIRTVSDGMLASYDVAPHLAGGGRDGLSVWAGTGDGPVYAAPGSSIAILTAVSTGELLDVSACVFTVSGYVINNP